MMNPKINAVPNRSRNPQIQLLTPERSESWVAASVKAGTSFLSAVAHFFAPSREQAVFSGIWVASILAASSAMSEGLWMSGTSQLVFGAIVIVVMATGVYVVLHECWADRNPSEQVPVPLRQAPEPEFRKAA